MASSSVASLILSISSVLHVCSGVTLEYKARYFTNATLYCDDSVLDLPYTVFRTYWILPDETVLQPEETGRRDKYIVGKSKYFSLTVQNVDDDDFARYYCVILWDNSVYMVNAINIDLEIDGERFAEMYRKNAVIGAISAAATVVVISFGCLVYCCRYQVVSREVDRKEEEIRVMQALDQAVNGFDESVPSDSDPIIPLPVRQRFDDVTDDASVKNFRVEINHLRDVYDDYDNKAFEIENEAMVPYAESDIDALPPYTVRAEYPNANQTVRT